MAIIQRKSGEKLIRLGMKASKGEKRAAFESMSGGRSLLCLVRSARKSRPFRDHLDGCVARIGPSLFLTSVFVRALVAISAFFERPEA